MENAIEFLKDAQSKRASIQINNNIWEYTEEPGNEWDEEDIINFACDLCNWAERGDYIGMILPNGEKVPFK